MRVAFYAPMKAPTHPVPSGDRRMGRLLLAALETAGHETLVASDLRTYDKVGDADVQQAHARAGAKEAERLIALWSDASARPEAWLTYHLYHKAPDFIGPVVARRLGMRYVVAEPSAAPKRATGPWAFGYRAAAACIAAADALLCLTRLDMACVTPFAGDPARVLFLPPFLDPAPFAAARAGRDGARASLAARTGLDPAKAWLLAVGMMRPGDKLESYRRLGQALALLGREDWQLLVVGSGEAEAEVRGALQGLPARFLPAQAPAELPSIYAAGDLYVWPAAGEAYGMAMLEAEAAGLPVVAGRVRGVPDVVMDGRTGLLVSENDAAAFAAAIRRLLDDPSLRQTLAAQAAAFVAEERTVAAAAAIVDRALGA